MKKVFISLLASILLILTLALSACGDDKNGTYYPANEEMKTNLENNGYEITIYPELADYEGNSHDGTLIYASKDREDGQIDFIYFYRFNSSTFCNYYYVSLQGCVGIDSLVMIKNDEKFGNIVYGGTENAINAAGIKVVEVEVKV